MSSSDDESEDEVPREILEAAKNVELNLLPPISRLKYDKVYEIFVGWMKTNKCKVVTEQVMLAYFSYLFTTKKYAPSTSWSIFSMLKSTLEVYMQVKINDYTKLRAYLKRKGEGYKPKKAKVFRPEELQKFLINAPDEMHLANKVNNKKKIV